VKQTRNNVLGRFCSWINHAQMWIDRAKLNHGVSLQWGKAGRWTAMARFAWTPENRGITICGHLCSDRTRAQMTRTKIAARKDPSPANDNFQELKSHLPVDATRKLPPIQWDFSTAAGAERLPPDVHRSRSAGR
jgi:hypothetical protein